MENHGFESTIAFTANDATRFDRFGHSLALARDFLVVGADQTQQKGNPTGSVYVFDQNTGSLVTELLPAAELDLADFGATVAADGNHLVVGAPATRSTRDGEVYVFDLSDLQTVPTILTQAEDFGAAVAIKGSYLAASAPQEDTNQGTVYLYRTSDFSLAHTFNLPATHSGNTGFGTYLVLSEEHLFTLSLDEENNNTFVLHAFDLMSGAHLYAVDVLSGRYSYAQLAAGGGKVFVSQAFQGLYAFNASDGSPAGTVGTLDHGFVFMESLAASEDFVFSGGAYSSIAAPGRVLVFRTSDLGLAGELVSDGVDTQESYGYRIANAGATVVVGSQFPREGSSDETGSVYLFSQTTIVPELTAVVPTTVPLTRGLLGPVTVSLQGTNFQGSAVDSYLVHLGDGVHLVDADENGWATVRFVSETEIEVDVESVDLLGEVGFRDVSLRFSSNADDVLVLGEAVEIQQYVVEVGFRDPHPADTNQDGHIGTAELLAFGDAVRGGFVPGVTPSEEDAYLRNASWIWKHGERYREVSGPPKPFGWVPDPVGGPLYAALASRAAQPLDPIEVYGLPPDTDILGLYRASQSLTGTALVVLPPEGPGTWRLTAPLHPYLPMDGGVVTLTFLGEEEGRSRYQALRANDHIIGGPLEILPLTPAPGTAQAVMVKSQQLIDTVDAVLPDGDSLRNYYGRADYSDVPPELVPLVALAEALESTTLPESLPNLLTEIPEAEGADQVIPAVEAVLAKAGAPLILDQLIADAEADSQALAATRALKLNAKVTTQFTAGPSITDANSLKQAMFMQRAQERFQNNQIVKDMNQASTVLGFFGTPGALASAAIGGPATLGKIRAEYIANTYPANLSLSATLNDPGFSSTVCEPAGTVTATVKATSLGWNTSAAIVDTLLLFGGAFDAARAGKSIYVNGLLDQAGEEAVEAAALESLRRTARNEALDANTRQALIKQARVNEFARQSKPAIADDLIQAQPNAINSQTTKMVAQHMNQGVLTIPSQTYGPFMLPTDCFEIVPLRGVFSASGDTYSPLQTGTGGLSIRTKGFPSETSVAEELEVVESTISIDLPPGSVAPGETVTLTAKANNIEPDTTMNWTATGGTLNVTDNGSGNGTSQAEWTAPAQVNGTSERFFVTVTAQQPVCLQNGPSEISSSGSLTVEEDSYSLVAAWDPSCLTEGDFVTITLFNDDTGNPAAGSFNLRQGDGVLNPISSSSAVFTAGGDASFVIIEATPDDSPHSMETIRFGVECTQRGSSLLTFVGPAPPAGRTYTLEFTVDDENGIQGNGAVGAINFGVGDFGSISTYQIFAEGTVEFNEVGGIRAFDLTSLDADNGKDPGTIRVSYFYDAAVELNNAYVILAGAIDKEYIVPIDPGQPGRPGDPFFFRVSGTDSQNNVTITIGMQIEEIEP